MVIQSFGDYLICRLLGPGVGVFLLESIARLLGGGNGGVFSNPEINLSTAF